MSAAPFTFRDMASADLPAVLAIERAAFDSPWTPEGFLACLADGSRCRVAVDETGALAGYCITHQVIDEAEVYTIAVSESHRRQGLGRALLREALEAAKLAAALRVFLEVRVTNTGALALYESEGFKRIGTRRGYYKMADGTREDAALMALEFTHAA